MPELLSTETIARYRRDGVLFPLPAIGMPEGRSLLGRFEELERREGGQHEDNPEPVPFGQPGRDRDEDELWCGDR